MGYIRHEATMKRSRTSVKRASLLPELAVFACALVMFNFPLLQGGVFDSAIFYPARVEAGQWWRAATHPFVHLTWYHLLPDAGAFLLLYGGLEETRRGTRIFYVIGCGLGSLVLSMAISPVIRTQGLCGLSGIAHGLMAISALESIRTGPAYRGPFLTGVISLVVVVLKSVVEVLQGHVFFEFLHFGMMGVPIPACHAGGVLTGILMFLMVGHRRGKSSRSGVEFAESLC